MHKFEKMHPVTAISPDAGSGSSWHTGVRSDLTDFNSVAQIFQEDPSVWALGASTLFCKGDLWILRNIRNNICLFVGKAVETCCVAMKQLQHLKSSIRSHIAVAAWEHGNEKSAAMVTSERNLGARVSGDSTLGHLTLLKHKRVSVLTVTEIHV